VSGYDWNRDSLLDCGWATVAPTLLRENSIFRDTRGRTCLTQTAAQGRDWLPRLEPELP